MTRSWRSLIVLSFLASACGGGEDGPTPPSTGALALRTTTTGTTLDPDGYQASVQGGSTLALPPSGTTYALALAPGSHDVTITGIASNCTLEGAATRTATIVVGDTVEVPIRVSCVTPPPPPALVVRTLTVGTELDADGYAISVEGMAPRSIGTNGEVVFGELAAGNRALVLSGVAGNCTTMDGASTTFPVASRDTAGMTFFVACGPAAAPGTILFRAHTFGAAPDPDGYTAGVMPNATLQVSINGTATLASVASGTHEVLWQGVASNCIRGTSGHTATVSGTAGGTSDLWAYCHAVPSQCSQSEIDLQVSDGMAPTITWAGACRLNSLHVIDRNTGEEYWFTSGFGLTSPVTYGEPSGGADRWTAARPLETGREYMVSIAYVQWPSMQLSSWRAFFTR